jgi:hypothetical protein
MKVSLVTVFGLFVRENKRHFRIEAKVRAVGGGYHSLRQEQDFRRTSRLDWVRRQKLCTNIHHLLDRGLLDQRGDRR